MAKLSANGTEITRIRTAQYDEVFGRDVIREYSLRDNGWVLVKVQHGDKSWTAWKRYGRFSKEPDVGTMHARGDTFKDALIKRLEARNNGRVEVVA